MKPPHSSDPEASREGLLVDAHSQDWSRRCATLFEDLRKPARIMVCRAYGSALSADEIEDVYAAAWAATLSALRDRGAALSDEELRAYVLTAVASHASKELRRRSRKPTGPLEVAHEQVIADAHLSQPEEAAIGSESAGIARDLLASLPARRRAVMLLRYGWGLTPKEVCALISGLSPRAYRKEVTKGVEQLIERLRQVESGEWCESREPLLRDYIAGTADEDQRRQVEQHLGHCRACSSFASKLSGHLHDLGSSLALATAAGVIGGRGLSLVDRLAALLDGGRSAAASVVEKGETALGAIATSGGVKGSGAAGTGLLAKIAAGGAGKGALACIGTAAAATACVAAGVVSGVSLDGERQADPANEPTARVERSAEPALGVRAEPAISSVVEVGDSIATSEEVAAAPTEEAGHSASEEVDKPEEVSTADPVEPAPEPAPAVVEEFDPVAASAAVPAEAAPAPEPVSELSSAGTSPSSAGAGSSSAAQQEFGP